jgi:hypothetical protein
MLLEWDYFSKVRPPTGLSFIPKEMHEHGEPWWNDDDRGKLLIVHQFLSSNPNSSHLVTEGMRIWSFKVFLFILASDFLHAIKSYDMWPVALLKIL